MAKKRIDRETVGKILDAADIVEVVSDFVRLKKKGANYIGLCPFHAERTPSFSVSKTKGICKCFSCGKGGSAVSFIMEHENLSYSEALRYLAKKYNIEIKEEALTEEEKKADEERESLLAVNEWALSRFQDYLRNTEDGKNIGEPYFKERGISDAMIERFRLGYDPEEGNPLANGALKAGYNKKYLVDTGLCFERERTSQLIDRFKGRVIYPVLSISGKVVAFGGRTLKNDKSIAKYINSPESLIYSKSKELYGLYQAKSAIVKKGYCILVEGYMDVISMAQAGIENVVASSGTSLTDGQIRLIHRFTDKVMLIYDSDPAGIKASLRGIDMLLAEGLDLSIVLLPEGEDPDSFAQGNSSETVENYLEQNAQDFIRFKTQVLLNDAGRDPIQRATAIRDIINSIAEVPDEVKRVVYCQECSRIMEMSEDVLRRQVSIARLKVREARQKDKERERAHSSIKDIIEGEEKSSNEPVHTPEFLYKHDRRNQSSQSVMSKRHDIADYEKEVLRYVTRYGFVNICDAVDEKGETVPMNVLQFIRVDLENDDLKFSHPVNEALFNEALGYQNSWKLDLENEMMIARQRRDQYFKDGIEEIAQEAKSLNDITVRENALKEDADNRFNLDIHEFTVNYLEKKLVSSPDEGVRKLATDLVSEKHHLSRYHMRYTQITTEEDRLLDLVVNSLNAWKYAMLSEREEKILSDILDALNNNEHDRAMNLMAEKQKLYEHKKEFGRLLGDRIVHVRGK